MRRSIRRRFTAASWPSADAGRLRQSMLPERSPANWVSPTLPGAVLPVWAEPFCIWSPSSRRAGAAGAALSVARGPSPRQRPKRKPHTTRTARAGYGSAEPGEALLVHAVHLGERAAGLGPTAARGDGRNADRAADDVGIPGGRDALGQRQRQQLVARPRVVALERVAMALAADAEVVDVAADADARAGDRDA